MKTRLRIALDLARSHLGASPQKTNEYYRINAVKREFEVGDNVLVQLPVQGSSLTATVWTGSNLDGINYTL